MTGKEIREHVEWLKNLEQSGIVSNDDRCTAQVGALWEIAAQLADINAQLRYKGSLIEMQVKGTLGGRESD